MPVHVYVDTEFTDFIDCELISIGLVADDGREFYGERSDFEKSSCSEFVRAAVLPQLGQYPDRVFTRDSLHAELSLWLDQYINTRERLLCFDYGGDWELLCDLMDGPPAGWQACRIGLDQQRMEDYFRRHAGRHHALIDARAMKYASAIED